MIGLAVAFLLGMVAGAGLLAVAAISATENEIARGHRVDRGEHEGCRGSIDDYAQRGKR